jgi:hypothetical protein
MNLYQPIFTLQSDLWTAGSIAYEIFGSENPFYSAQQGEKCLDSRTFTQVFADHDQLTILPVRESGPSRCLHSCTVSRVLALLMQHIRPISDCHFIQK